MSEAAALSLENRVLFLAPTRRDALTGQDILEQSGFAYKVCNSLDEICQEIGLGAAAVVVPEEAAIRDGADMLGECVRNQPAWSNLPILILTSPGRPARAIQSLLKIGEVSLLRRPLQVVEFLNAIQTAQRDRARQYQVRDHLIEQAAHSNALREADRRKDEFLAMLAHELRNPLAPIRNGLQILKLEGQDASTRDQTVQMMERQVQHLARLVDDLLDVSRITRGVAELRMERMDLTVAVSRAVEAVRPLVDDRHHALTVLSPDRPVWIYADITRITQVIANLLTNAAKYSEERAQIKLELEQVGKEAVVRVRDNGVGISAEMLPKVFDLFTQVDRNLDRSQGGLGIGLTLVRRLVEMHGGIVDARSEGIGCGSEFVVRLPVTCARDSTDQIDDKADSDHSQNFRILIVDDNVDAGRSLARVLALSGHPVQVAQSAFKGIELFREFQPEIALLDIGLPGMDGYALARVFRAERGRRPLQLVALTGYGQAEDRRRTKEAGFDFHVTKPADLTQLFQILGQAQHLD